MAPRLLTLRQAAAYLGIGLWAVRGLVNAGLLKVVVVPRPPTPEAMKPRARKAGGPKQAPCGKGLRVVRLDRADLDRFVDEQCEHQSRALPWNESNA